MARAQPPAAIVRSCGRALRDTVRPRVLALSAAPLLLVLALAAGAAWLWGAQAVALAHGWLARLSWLGPLWEGLAGLGWRGADTAMAQLLVLLAALPLLVLAALLLVAWCMTPVLERIAARGYPGLARRQGGSFAGGVWNSLRATAIALAVLAVSAPLWLVPPFMLVVPPLVWGWLTYRVMAWDALAAHASAGERATLLRQHRWPLLAIGIACGWLGAAPTVVWASGVLFVALLVPMVLLAVWLYTLVFVFSALWFLHYCLVALQVLRDEGPPADAPRPAGGPRIAP